MRSSWCFGGHTSFWWITFWIPSKFMVPGIGLAFLSMTSLGNLYLLANAQFLLVKLKLFAGEVHILSIFFRTTIPNLLKTSFPNVFMAIKSIKAHSELKTNHMAVGQNDPPPGPPRIALRKVATGNPFFTRGENHGFLQVCSSCLLVKTTLVKSPVCWLGKCCWLKFHCFNMFQYVLICFNMF